MNRILVPKEKKLEREVIITKNREGQIEFFTNNQFLKITKEIQEKLRKSGLSSRKIRRVIYSSASSEKIDKKGYVFIPKFLRKAP
ncbi:MAG: hypothetical protein COX34_01580 [Candidatus Nealsonbacteria bacterium CG23_combo_of_CG06-09_8_20_14_all_36_12]|uniref:Uncharacterized protein n=1 Tax=Candidatus Nealsonbacteria bacterium CG23_combo_of_CG06-09_8_20_14_all_36_12 TaxID=1974718 RepID=A0A2G9Z0A2_9BACT|nr:MAG: hypothetical protein COX34_01580 [Candidatus Nealsonbacteria bacterium CG23_combo_of_CG06-09_8_20_14_all_36_12]